MGGGKSRLSTKTIASLQDVTYFSDQEIQEWYKAFIKEVPDGQMNIDQFLNVWKDLFFNNKKKSSIDSVELQSYGKQVFRLIDRNGDGFIDFREFLINVSIEQRGTLEQKLEHVFGLYDLDQNGYVTKPEMLEFVKMVNRAMDLAKQFPGKDPEDVAEQLANKIFWRLDRNKDGKLTMFEFISGIKSNQCLVDYFLGVNLTGPRPK
ncbi:unnamed protein product [Allacma fusca]|uniref:EF-hand domain-containing protein n=1 Tax=Allacma fusca TaxID=39272 RepID=A0A8J2LJ74_9HEXA|nr:unnamed protein product [Allacma fusca]